MLAQVMGPRSPRTRRWSRAADFQQSCRSAFPAYAGVVPGAVKEPGVRARAFPAYAGVVPHLPRLPPPCGSVPRVRGGGPLWTFTTGVRLRRSPRTRGWSRQPRIGFHRFCAFPAYAGVVPAPGRRCPASARVPRVRGVVPGTRSWPAGRPGVPRVRGGGPLFALRTTDPRERSPRTRGWSPAVRLGPRPSGAFPAYAGGWSPVGKAIGAIAAAFPAYAGIPGPSTCQFALPATAQRSCSTGSVGPTIPRRYPRFSRSSHRSSLLTSRCSAGTSGHEPP